MRRTFIALCTVLLAAGFGATARAQQPGSSPAGTAEVEIGGKWEAKTGPNGRTNQVYTGGKWISISYGRPLKRGRELFGTGDAYATKLNAGAKVWRAGANVATTLKTQAPLVIGGKTLAPGEYLLFIDLKPGNWTLIVSSLKAQQSYDPNNKTETWGSYGYDESKDVVRVPMTVGEIPFSLEQLTWGFSDVTDKGGTINIWWDKTTASVPFTLGS